MIFGITGASEKDAYHVVACCYPDAMPGRDAGLTARSNSDPAFPSRKGNDRTKGRGECK